MIRPRHAVVLPSLPRHIGAWRRITLVLSPPGALALAMSALVALVPPHGEFPVDDDWVYAGVVQSLVEQGRLEIPVWAATSLVLQAYWGGLFAHLFGFSHTTLRVSTLVLAAIGMLGFYALLRELLAPRRALVGALLLLFNPLFIHHAYSFMTDVPFLALALWTLVCYVRASRGTYPSLGWLAVGSALAGGAFLVRQLGAMLPVTALVGVWLIGGWRVTLSPRLLMALLGPFLPAVLAGAYIDAQRGPVREEPLAWTLAFWAEQGPGMLGVMLARWAGACSTLGLFLLPLTIGVLATRSALDLARWQRLLAGALLLALLGGFVVRSAVFGQTLLFPHLPWTLTPRGFHTISLRGTLPEAIVVPEWALVLITAAALFGAGLLVLTAVAALSKAVLRGAAAVPLLFGLAALALTLPYYVLPHHVLYDRYLLAVLPSALLLALVVIPERPWAGALILISIALLALWSVWWQREYLERRAALWQAGLALVERGVPPQEIDGGREWNGWYRGSAVLAAAAQEALVAGGGGRLLDQYTRDGLNRRTRWTVTYRRPRNLPDSNVLAVVTYGRGQQVVAIQTD